jgi:hypothetical protein
VVLCVDVSPWTLLARAEMMVTLGEYVKAKVRPAPTHALARDWGFEMRTVCVSGRAQRHVHSHVMNGAKLRRAWLRRERELLSRGT